MEDVTIDKVLKFYKSCLEKIPETIENAIYSNEKAILQLQKNQIYDGKTLAAKIVPAILPITGIDKVATLGKKPSPDAQFAALLIYPPSVVRECKVDRIS